MSLIKWDPFREFNTLPAPLAFWGKDWDAPFSTTMRSPSVDIFENDNEVVVKAEMPGMDAKDIDVSARCYCNQRTTRGHRPRLQ